ncbi:MAG TPA: tetratricopeptide repeat protein [Verrucomicrobiae bacterium]|nr:tetratricopeptide repeat protein [Verrucomicrobiae bacterium]
MFLTSSPHRFWLLGLLLISATIMAYQPAWHAGFIWDDDKYVTQNPLLSAPDGLWRIWFSLESPSQYFPLTYSAFRLEKALWGLNPDGYHWVNILMHVANALLLWRLLYRLGLPGAWLATTIFALHPVQVESVAWITELKSILSLFFILLALLAWIKFMEEPPRRLWGYYGVALVCYLLALCSKTTACTFPAVLLLLSWLKGWPITRTRFAQIVPFCVLGLGMGLLAMWWERYHQGTQGRLFDFGLVDRILIASHAAWFYLGKLVWPVNLTFSYPRWNVNPADPLAYGWLVAGVILVAGIFLTRRQTGRSLAVVVLFYLVTLAPTLGFIMLYTFRYSFVADHYQYVASIGLIAFAAAAVTMAFNNRPFSKLVFCGALLLTLGTLTWHQCGMYADRETLWRVTLARNPASLMAHNNLGVLLFNQGRVKEAIDQYQQAVGLNPDDSEAHNNLGNALLQEGSGDEAINQYQQAVKLDPGFANGHNNLGNALLHQGQIEQAIVEYEAAIKLAPNNPFFLSNLAWLRATRPQASFRNGVESVQLAERACQLTGYNEPQLIGTLAAAYAEAGRFEEAVAASARARDLAQSLGEQRLALKNQELMKLFENHQPWREQAAPIK